MAQPLKMHITKAGKVRIPPGKAQRIADVTMRNTDPAQPATVTLTDAAGNIVFDAQLGPASSARLSGPTLHELAAGQDVTATVSGAVDGTLTTADVNPGR